MSDVIKWSRDAFDALKACSRSSNNDENRVARQI